MEEKKEKIELKNLENFKILSVDSSSVTASVSILEINNYNNIKIISEFFVNSGLTHSQTLAPMIDNILKICDINIKEIDLFGVTVGPGSFTGLRIGLATVKAMAFALNKYCAGVSSLETLAYNYYNFKNMNNNIIISCMDARRNQVYNSIFEVKNNNLLRITQDKVNSIEELYQELNLYVKSNNFSGYINFVGDGSELCYNKFLEYNINNNLKLLPVDISKKYIKSSNIGILSLELYKNNKLLLPENINPVYLRLSQAERLLLEKNKNINKI